MAEKAEIDTDMNLITSNYNARKNKAASDKLSSYVGKQKQLLDEIEAEKQQVKGAVMLLGAIIKYFFDSMHVNSKTKFVAT